ncbi:hypothetical protein LVY72_05020 [Arthrobacter sp. I2-34]|uniref:Uncharacterized protein n=1 Tax=Arthrobacter hankyongi TaxID=2904801 RepID=A0ABS9L3Z3_9MICC|nr:hypothetical protein [Arthrobacter hankyongi]MCG2621273.1 hypothetical protein [Arthrobacter hankyongi]
MEFTGDYFAAAAPGDADAQVRVYHGAQGLDAVQLGEALDNPELLEGNWQLVHTIPAAAASTEDIVASLAGDTTLSCAEGESQVVGRWRIVRLQDVRLVPGRQVR